MADKVEFELVSPEKVLVSRGVDMVVVPGRKGISVCSLGTLCFCLVCVQA